MSIDQLYLEGLWESISENEIAEFSYKRIDTNCVPELSIGLASSGNRCLVLELPKNSSVDIQTVLRKNLSLALHSNSIIVLELKNPKFNDIFSDLVISLYWSIKDISVADSYAPIFIETFYKWSDFFSERQLDRLSEEAIKGLFGELTVLRRFLEGAHSSEVNSYLLSWKGPYDLGKDFELDDRDIEVKARNLTKLSVSISSEHQLDPTPGKPLQLWIVALQSGEDGYESISEQILAIKKLIVVKLGDLSIFLKALWQKGLTVDNSVDYDSYKFSARLISCFDASNEEFPSLKKTSISQAITKVKYDLRITHLDNYLIEEIKL